MKWGEKMPEIGSIIFKDSETEIILGVCWAASEMVLNNLQIVAFTVL